jgi:hypothetical protein
LITTYAFLLFYATLLILWNHQHRFAVLKN